MRIPTATYRIQFHQDFTFISAQAIVDYLAELGISDLYASPIFKARAGSTHGYDVVNPTQINPEIGTTEQFDCLVSALQQRQMGWLQDIVPNHMAYDSENQFLMDVLENGSDSDAFNFFDIEWNHPHPAFKGRVLAPFLGSFYGECLEKGEIQLAYSEAGLSIHYHSLILPVRIESYASFITHNLGQLTKTLGRRHPDFIKLLGTLYLIKSVPLETKGRERHDQTAFVKGLLWELYTQNAAVQAFFNANTSFFNGEIGKPETFNLLDTLLSGQFYRLAFWKVGAEEINYRRFFTVNELISVRVEELKVFNQTHTLIEQWIKAGSVTGLRVDHIDGLYHPTQYLQRLRDQMGDTYTTVEKILELHEDMPHHWQTEGTSGYEVLNYINGLFCQPNNERQLRQIYTHFTDLEDGYDELVVEKKRLIIEKNLAGDVDNLAQLLQRIAAQTRQGNDFTAYGLKRSLSEILALFPIYRTYIDSSSVSETDQRTIQQALDQAEASVPLLLNELHYIKKLLLRQDEEHLTDEQKQERLHFVMKFQQLTGPLMAKGAEDTTLYVYNPLLSLNEVGGNPGHFGITVEQFHAFHQRRCDRWLHSMNTTATHDTKRGEDARARLNVLSEIPSDWYTHLHQWSELNLDKKQYVKGKVIPDPNDEYFLYQTLLGSFPTSDDDFPEYVERIKAYVIKAVREAKVHTAWLRPDSTYEQGYITFVERILATSDDNEFLRAFRPVQARIAKYGVFNSLSQVLLKNTVPGVPDLYQGNELWDLSLVDPDNRRPVNYEQRLSWLQEIKNRASTDLLQLIQELLTTPEDGKVKLFLTMQVLQARKQYLQLFQHGKYQPMSVSGKFAEHVIAFARVYAGQVAIALVPRFLTQMIQPDALPLGKEWQDTTLHLSPTMPTTWVSAITTQPLHADSRPAEVVISVAETFQHFPVALLIGHTSED